MNDNRQMITPFQLFFIILLSQIGIAVFTLPAEEILISGNDAWLSVIAAGLLVQVNIVLIWLLHRRFPSRTVFGIINEVAGVYAGFLLRIVYIVYFFVIASFIVLLFGRMVSVWILPNTPLWIINLILLAIGVLCVKENLRIMARFFVVVSFLLVVLLLLLTSILRDASFISVLPVGTSGLPAILRGVNPAIIAFTGFESLLVIFPRCLGTSSAKLKTALLANGLTTFFYTYLTFVSIAYLGPYAMKYIPEPILYIMKYRSFSILERTDLLFFSIWVVCVGSSLMTYLYLAASGLSELLKSSYNPVMVCSVALLVFALVCFVPIEDQIIHLLDNFDIYLSYSFICGLPLILLLLSILRGKRETPGAM